MPSRNFYRVVVWSLAGVSMQSAVFADDADGKPEVMVVSAARTAMDLAQIASSVTVIDREIIEQRQSAYIVDLLRGVPGLSVNRSGSGGGITEVRSRGGEANQLLVLIDGIRANDPAANDQFQWQTLTANDVERIEIVRGPQSAIWGSDANTGVINIITRKGSAGLSGSGFVEGGSYNSASGGLRAGGGTQEFTWGANASYLEQSGFNSAQSGSEDDPFKNKTAGFNLAYKPTDAVSVDLVTRYSDADADGDWQDCVPSPGNDPCPQVVSDSFPDSSTFKQLYSGLSGTAGFLENRWTHQLFFATTDTRNKSVFQFRDFFAPDTLLVDTFRANGRLNELRYQTNWDFARAGVAAGKDLVTFAIDHQKREYDNSFDVDDNTYQTGYVLEGRTLLADVWSITGAVRYDDSSDYDDITTWRITSGYDFPATGTRLRAAAGTGQKAPTSTELFGFTPDFVGNPDLEPEQSEGWELGIDQTLGSDKYTSALTYFNERLEDQIVSVFLPDFSSTVTNAPGDARRKGVEAALDARLNEQFTGRLSYTYLDSDAVVLAGDIVTGRSSEIRRPRNSYAMNLNYKFLQQKANLNLNLSYTGSQYDNVFFSDFSSSRIELDSYTLVDLTSEYALTDSVVLYGRLDNLFDEDYEQVYSYNTLGRAGYVGVRMSLTR